jgi:hypothetical protein
MEKGINNYSILRWSTRFDRKRVNITGKEGDIMCARAEKG